MSAIGFNSFSIDDVAYLISGVGQKQGSDVLIASGQTSAITPDHRIPPGSVVVKKTATGKYYLADDGSNGDRNTQASVTASETADGDWKSATITLNLNGVDVVTVTLGGSDDTDAEVVTALNGNAVFAANAVASAAGSRVIINSLRAGADVYMKITSSLSTAFGSSGTQAAGTDADYRVTAQFAELKDINAAAQDYSVASLLAGHFRSSKLANSTNEALAVLRRRGSVIE